MQASTSAKSENQKLNCRSTVTMAGFGQDDIDDFDNYSQDEEFNEDDLDDEEYDKLYENLPKLKETIASYNDTIEELALKEALYYNYYKIDEAIEELKSKFPKKKDVDTAPIKPLSKLQQLALARKQQKSEIKEESPSTTPGKPNKLAALAKLRAVSKGTETASGSLSILEGLKLPSSNASDSKIRLSKLQSRLLSKKFGKSAEEKTEIQKKLPDEKIPEISFDIVHHAEKLLPQPRNSVSVFLFDKKRNQDDLEIHMQDNRNKRRRFSTSLFGVLTNHEAKADTVKKTSENFSKPSPDDKILTAQKNAFEENMKGLNISEAKEKAPPKNTKPFKKIDLEKELKNNNVFSKENKSFVVIGHVDAGKSTLMGRLLFDSGVVDAKTVNKLVREAEKSGKGSFALAWVMDQTSEERSRGVTVDICATEFETKKCRFTAIDAPGHKDFVPQMISGVSQAEIALLVVDAISGEFEAGFNMDGQTKEHTMLAKNLGIERICVAVNKLDKEDWSKERYSEIKEQLIGFLTTEVGFKPECVSFVPISGLTGNNVVKRDEKLTQFSWYEGPTLVNFLENVEVDRSLSHGDINEITSEDFVLTITDIVDVSNSEFSVSGRVSSGSIQPGQTVKFSPTNDFVQVQSLKSRGQSVDLAVKGDTVTMFFKLNGLTNKNTDDLSLGDVALTIDNEIQAVERFTAQLSLFNMTKPLLVGTPFVLFRNNSHVPARISKIIHIDGSTKKKKMHLVSKQSAEVEIEVTGERLLPVTKFSDNKFLGRVVIRREGASIGAGIITEI